MTPAGVYALCKAGHQVYVETNAGNGSGFSDQEYQEAGAIISSSEEVFAKADLIVKVKEYLENKISKEEMIEKIKQESRRYAKRQITWFKKNKQTIWINGLNKIEDNINLIINSSGI